MDITEELKTKIARMTYAEMLTLWRFSSAGDVLFVGESGKYFKQQMEKKKQRHPEPVAVSKRVGWPKETEK